MFAWMQTFRALELEPRAVQAAQQIAEPGEPVACRAAGQPTRSTASRGQDDERPGGRARAAARAGRQVGGRSRPTASRAPSPSRCAAPRHRTPWSRARVNKQQGLWVGFMIDKGRLLAADRPNAWAAGAGDLAAVGRDRASSPRYSARRLPWRAINQPLQELSFAASRIGDGEFDRGSTRNT